MSEMDYGLGNSPRESNPSKNSFPASLNEFRQAQIAVTEGSNLSDRQLCACARIYTEAFNGPPWFEQWSEDSAAREILLQINRDARLSIATDDRGAICGMALALPLAKSPRAADFEQLDIPSQDTAWYFSDFCVAKNARGMGLGRALLEDALAIAKGCGASGMLTRTRSDNIAAQKIFEGLGFKQIGIVMSSTGEVSSQRIIYYLGFEIRRISE